MRGTWRGVGAAREARKAVRGKLGGYIVHGGNYRGGLEAVPDVAAVSPEMHRRYMYIYPLDPGFSAWFV